MLLRDPRHDGIGVAVPVGDEPAVDDAANLLGRLHAIECPEKRSPVQDVYPLGMSTAALVIASIGSAVSIVVVLAMFVWAARKDGEYDRSVQKRLGIRRRTRL
jgi:hypothetical protein